MTSIHYTTSPQISNEAMNQLFSKVWDDHTDRDFQSMFHYSLGWIAAFSRNDSSQEQLVGFINVAWDGGMHAFLLDTAVHSDYRRQGIGTQLVNHAIALTKERNVVWLHVDYEPHLETFYKDCGFRHTEAGLINLR